MPGKPYFYDRSLFTGDNLNFLRGMNSESVDLIYADPPRNTGRRLEATPNSRAKGYVFEDRWTAGDASQDWEDEIDVRKPEAMQVINTAKMVLDEASVNYLVFLAVRLLELQRVLKTTGSIYLQCRTDSTHYLKALMDAIFGNEQFKSDIAYKRVVPTAGPKRWKWAHDSLLFYAGPRKHRWHPVPQPHTPEFLARFAFKDERGEYEPASLIQPGVIQGDRSVKWRGFDPSERGQHWAVPVSILQQNYPEMSDMESLRTTDKLDLLEACGLIHWPRMGSVPRYKKHINTSPGEDLSDVLTTIGQIDQKSQEGTGWPGQVPKALLDIIIRASSNEGDIVLDPFSGSGTACVVAENLNRCWVGIELAPEGFDVLKSRMRREARGTQVSHGMFIPERPNKKGPSDFLTGKPVKDELYKRQHGYCAGCNYELPRHMLEITLKDGARRAQATSLADLQLLCHHCNVLRGRNDQNYLALRLHQLGILPH